MHAAQRNVLSEARRFNVVNCGRRWGKDTMANNLYCETGLNGYAVAWFNPTYKMLSDTWREIVRAMQPVATRIRADEHRIELVTGGVLDMWSLDSPDVARGRKYKRAIINEAAMIPALMDAWTYVIRPTLADDAGDAWFLSTPKGMNGFHQMHAWGQDDGRPEWASWTRPTWTNPFIAPAEIDAMRRDMTAKAFSQEIEAKFLQGGGAVFRRVRESANALAQARAIDGHSYVFGVDWARTNDYTVISVIDTTTKELCALDRFTGIGYELQLTRLRALYDRFKPYAIVAEQNSMGGPLIELLHKTEMPVKAFNTTNASKAEAIDALALAFERGDIRILHDETLIYELEAYEQETLPSGAIRYGAPAGSHDDCVMSLALAWSRARRSALMAG